MGERPPKDDFFHVGLGSSRAEKWRMDTSPGHEQAIRYVIRRVTLGPGYSGINVPPTEGKARQPTPALTDSCA